MILHKFQRPSSRWVVKIGSSLLTANGQGLAKPAIANWVDQIAELRRIGVEIVLVSSGAVAEGMTRLGLSRRPQALSQLQAAAAVGQMGLVQVYESNFQRHGLHTAQILLTRDDLTARERYINARSTLKSLLEMNVVPVVNENDTVVTDELRFGDNDTLAALVANLIEADVLLLLTDQEGLFNRDPRKFADASLVREASAADFSLDDMAGQGTALGRGGMVTKVKAARIAARSGADTIITAGRKENVILNLYAGTIDGTWLRADSGKLVSRKQWLAGLPARGTLTLDAGAVSVLRNSGRSLLPIGVSAVRGSFTRGDMVSCEGPEGQEVARGLVNYNLHETQLIIGRSSDAIESILGYLGDKELIHRDNLVIV
jgi:glutamate 5-kinase